MLREDRGKSLGSAQRKQQGQLQVRQDRLQADGGHGVTSQEDEIIQNAYPVKAQDLGKGLAETFLLCVGGCLVICLEPFDIRRRDRLPVDLAIGAHRQGLHLFHEGRQHIVGKEVTNSLLYRPGRKFPVGRIDSIKAFLAGCIFKTGDHGLPGWCALNNGGFNLTWFHSESTDFQHPVFPVNILQNAVFSEITQITCPKEPVISPALGKRVGNEFFLAELRQVKIAGRNLPADTNLPCLSRRQTMALLIKDVNSAARGGQAARGGRVSLVDREAGKRAAGLTGTVETVNPAAVTIDS